MAYTPCIVCVFPLMLHLFPPAFSLSLALVACSSVWPLNPPPFCCFSKVKVCDLERKCRSQSEHFHQLSDELLNFRLRSDTVEILQINPAPTPRISRCSEKNFSRVALGFKVQTKTGGSRLSTHNQTSDRFGIETPGLEQSMVTLTVLWG